MIASLSMKVKAMHKNYDPEDRMTAYNRNIPQGGMGITQTKGRETWRIMKTPRSF